MLSVKNNKQQIYPRREENLFFGVFCCPKERKHHGSIFVLLLGYALGFAPLQPIALATDQDIIRAIEENRALLQGTIVGSQATTDGAIGDVKSEVFDANSHLSYIEASAENIETDVEYIDRHVGNIMNDLADLQSSLSSGALHDLFQRIETNTRTNSAVDLQPIIDEVSKLQKNLGWLVSGSALEDDDGEGYPNRITATHYGNSSITMSDALQFIAQGVGGIDTAGNPSYQSQAMMPLINTIIGWGGGFADNNIKTNGIIGLLRQVNKTVSEIHSMTNLVVSKMDEQINVISNGLARLAYLGSENAWLMTNQIYMASGYTGLPNKNNNFGAFMRSWQRSESFNGSPPSFPDEYSQPYWGGLLTLPYYTLPLEENELKILYADRSPYFPEQGDIEELRKAFYQYYGNMRTFEDAYGDEEYEQSSIYDSASNLVSRTRGGDVTNSIPNSLSNVLGIPQLDDDVSDIEDIGRDYKHFKGPSEPEVKRISQYFSDSQIKSQNKAGFEFSVDFSNGSAEGGASIEIENRELLNGVNIQTIAASFQPFITYGVSIFKGILLLCFVWHCAEKAISLLNGGIQND